MSKCEICGGRHSDWKGGVCICMQEPEAPTEVYTQEDIDAELATLKEQNEAIPILRETIGNANGDT